MNKAYLFYLLRRGIIGGRGSSPWVQIVNDFETRVIADGGTLEAKACLKTDVQFLTENPEPVPVPSTDADYQAVLDRSTALGYTTPSASQQTIQNTLVTDLKAAGVWDKLDVFYCFATDGDSDFATLNWKAPSSHQVTKVNSPAFNTNSGFAGNGSSSYLNTNYNPATSGANYTLNDASISIWSNDFVLNNFITGVESSSFNCLRMSSTSANQRINMGASAAFAPRVNLSDSSKKFRQLNRTSSTDATAFIDTTSTTHTASSTEIESQNQTILRSANAYSSTEAAFFGMGASLVSENADFYNALNTYKSAL